MRVKQRERKPLLISGHFPGMLGVDAQAGWKRFLIMDLILSNHRTRPVGQFIS
jgi:hypothetical protein